MGSPFFSNDPELQRNFENLQSKLDTGGRSLGIRGAIDTLTFPGGSPNATVKTITHGLGKAPTTIQVTPIAAATPVVPFVVAASVGATTFQVGGRMSDGSSPVLGATQTFYWDAKG